MTDLAQSPDGDRFSCGCPQQQAGCLEHETVSFGRSVQIVHEDDAAALTDDVCDYLLRTRQWSPGITGIQRPPTDRGFPIVNGQISRKRHLSMWRAKHPIGGHPGRELPIAGVDVSNSLPGAYLPGIQMFLGMAAHIVSFLCYGLCNVCISSNIAPQHEKARFRAV